MSSFSHPIKTEFTTLLHMGWGYENQTQIHKKGCAHERKAQTVSNFDQTKYNTKDIYFDDHYYVAPCARKK